MYPMKMTPACKDYIWGGERLAIEYGKETPLRPIAESWEISCHPDGPSLIANGLFMGQSLFEVLQKYPEMMGQKCGASAAFPILIKLIDAKEDLSVQVHPPDAYAWTTEGQQGKNEMWYIMDCMEGASLILGFKRPISMDEYKERIENNTIEAVLNKVPVRPGDCFCVPAGLVHAIGKGILIAEIQQSSNVTYRLYDYNRTGPDGKPRPLHLQKALEVTDTSLKANNASDTSEYTACDGYKVVRLAEWDYFHTQCFHVQSHATLVCGDESFHCPVALDSQFELIGLNTRISLGKGESVFVPAGFREYTVLGRGKMLLTHM